MATASRTKTVCFRFQRQYGEGALPPQLTWIGDDEILQGNASRQRSWQRMKAGVCSPLREKNTKMVSFRNTFRISKPNYRTNRIILN